MIKPLIFAFAGEELSIQFVKIPARVGKAHDWNWIFTRADGHQIHWPEHRVREFLDISERTAIYWRRHRHPNPAALYALHLYVTGRIISPTLAKNGVRCSGPDLHYKARKITERHVPDWDFLLWLLREQRLSLQKAEKAAFGSDSEKAGLITPEGAIPTAF